MALLISGCAGDREFEQTASYALTDTGETALARHAQQLGAPRGDLSGIHLIRNGGEALAMRLYLTEQAERSIDAQYYLLHDDPAGHLFVARLLQAADRGVRVRLLLDDMDTRQYDAMTAALTGHPNFEIRLFNPFWRDRSKVMNGVIEFWRINRRMHNKSMIFDNQMTVLGGRNIGGEYFSARDDSNFDDLDLLGVGPIARDVSTVFDDYWNSPHAVPAEAVIDARSTNLTLPDAREQLEALNRAAAQSEYGQALRHELRQQIDTGTLDVEWAPALVLADPPSKTAGETNGKPILAEQMLPYLQEARHEVFVVSAYFVPGEAGTAFLGDLARRGIRVRILTNSLDSNDVEAVHAHYRRYRADLLGAGVELWELRADKTRADREALGLGQSLSALHTKAFAVDRDTLFVGSFNWDPRSVRINTEMGALILSPALAREAVGDLEQELARTAYKLRLDSAGEVEWMSMGDDGTWTIYKTEPSSSIWRNIRAGFYGLLPIEGLL
ncbi:MAG: phospholipase D family protein [Tropicimonas sp.]|uniref:phospholipase D family protein n=1 Tax=Tropicimonas sp. TaxID=2067044 RepID=UPI003A8360F1